jgi:hypothetical protein
MARRILHPNHDSVPKNFCRLPDGYGVVKIGVSGSADLTYSGLDAFERAKEVGREIARHNGVPDVCGDGSQRRMRLLDRILACIE